MSHRVSKGKALAGKFQADNPGGVLSGIPFSVAGTTATTTSFKFNLGDVIKDVFVKITSVSSSTNTISIGLATGASSAGVSTALVTTMAIPTTGTFFPCASTSHASLSFNYGSYMIASTSGASTVLEPHVVGSTDTYVYLNYACATTAATVGVIYPVFYELA